MTIALEKSMHSAPIVKKILTAMAGHRGPPAGGMGAARNPITPIMIGMRPPTIHEPFVISESCHVEGAERSASILSIAAAATPETLDLQNSRSLFEGFI